MKTLRKHLSTVLEREEPEIDEDIIKKDMRYKKMMKTLIIKDIKKNKSDVKKLNT